MGRTNKTKRPTDAELGILVVLWKRGPSTVREVQEQLNRARRTGYTTVLKFLQIMTEKGLVRRDESNRTHVYEAAVSEARTQGQLVSEILNKAFGGSAARLVAQALTTGKPSDEELREIRELLNKLERGAK